MNRIIATSIFITFVLFACRKDNETVTYFYIQNRFVEQVVVTIFNAEIQDLGTIRDTTYVINPNTSVSNSYVLKGKNSDANFPFGVTADSAFITFANGNRTIYRRNDNKEGNILNIASYDGGRSRDNLFEYFYFIE